MDTTNRVPTQAHITDRNTHGDTPDQSSPSDRPSASRLEIALSEAGIGFTVVADSDAGSLSAGACPVCRPHPMAA